MSRLQQLKLLYDEIQIFFDQGIGEQEAYDRLNSDSRFDSIRRTDIHYLYQKLQKKAELENEEKDLNKEMQSYNKILDSLKADQARLKNSYNQADSGFCYTSDQKRRFTAEYVKLKPYRQNAKNYLISDTVAKSFKPYITSFWQGRYALEQSTVRGNLQAFDLTDLFHDKSKKITVQRVGQFTGFYELSSPYVLLVENHASGRYFLRLMGLDPSTNQMQLIQEIERGTSFQVFVDSLNPKNFVLQNNARVGGSTTNVCTLVNGRVQIGEEELEWKVNSMPAYSDGQLLGFWCEPHYTMENAEMKIFDLKQNKKTSLKMNSLPGNVVLRTYYVPNSIYAWIQNRCYVIADFKSSDNYGIVYADSETRNWIVLEFASNLPIYRLQMTIEQELMFYSEGKQLKDDSKLMERRVFKIPLKKPDFLRCLAWFKFVGLMKKTQVSNDPKRKARMRLPYNTDVQLFKCIR